MPRIGARLGRLLRLVRGEDFTDHRLVATRARPHRVVWGVRRLGQGAEACRTASTPALGLDSFP